MNNVIYILMLHLSIVYIVDISGFINSVKTGISKIIRRDIIGFKPFDCSSCLNVWAILTYCIVLQFYPQIISDINSVIVALFTACCFAFVAPLTGILMMKVILFYERL